MMDGERLLWLGETPPRTLQGLCTAHSVELVCVDPMSLDAAASRAIGLAISMDGVGLTEAGALRPSCLRGLDHGLHVALVSERRLSGGNRWSAAEYATLIEAIAVLEVHERVKFTHDDYDYVLRWMRAGTRPVGTDGVTLDGVQDLSAEQQILLRRAFAGHERINLTRLSGGRSGAGVFLVAPMPRARPRALQQTVVAKVQGREKAASERSKYGLLKNATNFRSRAELLEDRCVDGSTQGVLVYGLVSHARPLAEVIERDPGRWIRSLAERTLAHFNAADPSLISVGKWILSSRVVGPTPTLEAAIGAKGAVDEMLNRLEGFPSTTTRLGTIHGDLHIGNLFAQQDGDDVIMIDFGRVEEAAPVALDLAMLEVSLSFPAGEAMEPSLAPPVLQKLYADCDMGSVPRTADARGAWVLDAIAAIRTHAARVEPTPAVRTACLAASLLRYASYSDNGTPVSRRLACGLGRDLLVSIGGA